MIDKSTIDKIYLAASIVEVVGDFVALNKKGTNFQACCPFHDEKTPSFVVSPSKGIFKCFGCGKAGNAVTFVMEHEKISYVEALRYLAKKYGIQIEEKEYTDEQKAKASDRESLMAITQYATKYFTDKLNNSSEGKNIGKSYFYERGFSDETIEKFQLGYSLQTSDAFSRKAIADGYKEKYAIDSGLTIKRDNGGYYDRFCGRVIFPIHSVSGSVIGFGGRILTSDKNKAKYLNSPESDIYHKSYTLYGIHFAKNAIVKENKCILVEGYTDVISMMQSGIENIVASSGTSLTIDQIKLIARFTKNITVIYDGDSAGIKASMRGIDMILAEGMNVRVVPMPNGEDPDSFARTHTAHQTKSYIAENEDDFVSFKTKLLLSEVNDDPMGRSEVINDIINTISIIPDDIVCRQFAKECSKLMGEDEQFILRTVDRKRIEKKDGAQGVRYYDYKLQKESYQKKEIFKSKPLHDGQEIEFLEKELIGYLLKYGKQSITIEDIDGNDIEVNVANEIIEELQFDELNFENQVCQVIFDEYIKIIEEGVLTEDSVIMNSFINHINPDVCKYIIDLITSEEVYKPSKLWAKLDREHYENDVLSEAIPKSLAIYKLKILEKLKNEYLNSLKNNKDNLELLRHINVINNERKKTCQKYSRIV